jgi:hypothetical protein
MNLCVITKPRNYDVITRFRNYMTTLQASRIFLILIILLYFAKKGIKKTERLHETKYISKLYYYFRSMKHVTVLIVILFSVCYPSL